MAIQFLRRKLEEYEQIKQQITELGKDIQSENMPLPEVYGLSDLMGKTVY